MVQTPRLEFETLIGQTWEKFSAKSVVVKEAAGAHSLAKVVFLVPTVSRSRVDMEEGSPVALTWGDGTRTRTLHAYVHRVGVNSGPGGDEYELLLAGPSWPLKAGSFRVFHNRTAAEILTTIAREHGLSHSSDASFRVFDSFSHRGSDWEALRRLAADAGAVLRCDDGTLRLLDPTAHMHRAVQHAALLTPEGNPTATVKVTSENADERAAIAGFVSPGTTQVQWVRDFHPGYVEPTEKFLAAESVPPASSYRDAAGTLAARRAAKRFRYRAVCSGFDGDVRMKVAAPVALDGFSGSSSGTWSLREATHMLTPTSYTMDVTLGSYAAPTFYTAPRTALVPSGLVAPPMSLRNGLWVSSWR